MGGLSEVLSFGLRDVHEGLWISVEQWEPGTLDLNHETVPLLEGMEAVEHIEGNLGRPPRHEGFRSL